MPLAKATWAILEGGITQTFPLSINQSMEWIRLRRGECSSQINVSHEKDGVFEYARGPVASTAFFAEKFVPVGTDPIANPNTTQRVWAYGRWWRINPDNKYQWQYSDLGQGGNDEFVVYGYDEFNEDGDDDISMVATSGDGTWFILKPKCGYTLSNANGDSSGFRKSSAYFGIGNCNTGNFYTNAIIAGNVVTTWDCGGDSTARHYLWDGKNGSVELSRNIRDLAGVQGKDARCAINWAENLVIAGGVVYDLDNKRVLQYSTALTASGITRPYFDPHFKPVKIYSFAFFCTGRAGSFDVTLQYGQAQDDLNEDQVYHVKITEQTKNRFRQMWVLNNPVGARVYRLKIDNLTGTGITQIDVKSEVAESVDSYDDVS